MLEFVQLEKLGSPVLNNDHFSDQQDSPRLQAYRGGALRGADGDAASILSMSLNEGDAQVSSAETGEEAEAGRPGETGGPQRDRTGREARTSPRLGHRTCGKPPPARPRLPREHSPARMAATAVPPR